jgi:hypothetical protein
MPDAKDPIVDELAEGYNPDPDANVPAQSDANEQFQIVSPGSHQPESVELGLHDSAEGKGNSLYTVTVSWSGSGEPIFNRSFPSLSDAQQTYSAIKVRLSAINGKLIDKDDAASLAESESFLADMKRMTSPSLVTRSTIKGKCRVTGGEVSYEVPEEYEGRPYHLLAYLGTIKRYTSRSRVLVGGKVEIKSELVFNGSLKDNVDWYPWSFPEAQTRPGR